MRVGFLAAHAEGCLMLGNAGGHRAKWVADPDREVGVGVSGAGRERKRDRDTPRREEQGVKEKTGTTWPGRTGRRSV